MGDQLTLEQHKLLANQVRQQILGVLYVPLTAKEVAVAVNATVGNAHYHLQRLVEGELVRAEESMGAGGTMEKRYRARDEAPVPLEPEGRIDARLLHLDDSLWLTVAETGQFVNELKAFFYRWQSSYQEPRGRAQPIRLSVTLDRSSTS